MFKFATIAISFNIMQWFLKQISQLYSVSTLYICLLYIEKEIMENIAMFKLHKMDL